MDDSRLMSWEVALAAIGRWRSNGELIVFTNGVFDILHLGHVNYLGRAAALGQRLIVGLNADNSVKRLNKSPERPINSEIARAGVLGALRVVDAVVIFNQDTPLELILDLEPDILVKGGDYDPEETNPDSKRYMVGSAEIRSRGGLAAVIPLTQGYSSTGIIKKMRSGTVRGS